MPAVYPAFFFVLEKGSKSAGNAVIPTFPTRWSHGLQYLRHKRLTFAFVGESGYTLGFAQRIAHSGLHAETGGCFGWGWYRYPRRVLHVHEHPRAGCQNGVLCRFGILAGRCSRRTQKAFGTAMRLCASLFRGVAAPPGCVICLQLGDVAVFSLCAQYFLNVRGGGGITTLGAFHTFRKPCVARG